MKKIIVTLLIVTGTVSQEVKAVNALQRITHGLRLNFLAVTGRLGKISQSQRNFITPDRLHDLKRLRQLKSFSAQEQYFLDRYNKIVIGGGLPLPTIRKLHSEGGHSLKLVQELQAIAEGRGISKDNCYVGNFFQPSSLGEYI